MSNLSNIKAPAVLPYKGFVYKLVLSEDVMEFATEAAAKTEANWTTLMKVVATERGFVTPQVFKDEGTQDEPVNEVGLGNQTIKLRQNAGVMKYHIPNCPAKYRKKLQTFNERNLYVYKIYSNNYIEGRTDVETELKVRGDLCKVFVEYTKTVGDTETPKVMITLQPADPESYMTYAKEFVPNFDAKLDLTGLEDVVLAEVGTSTANAFVVSVLSDNESIPITGLVKADFEKNGATFGVGVTMTDNEDGTYSFSGTGIIADQDVITLVTSTAVSLMVEMVGSGATINVGS